VEYTPGIQHYVAKGKHTKNWKHANVFKHEYFKGFLEMDRDFAVFVIDGSSVILE
jgi:hypothetical protein